MKNCKFHQLSESVNSFDLAFFFIKIKGQTQTPLEKCDFPGNKLNQNYFPNRAFLNYQYQIFQIFSPSRTLFQVGVLLTGQIQKPSQTEKKLIFRKFRPCHHAEETILPRKTFFEFLFRSSAN